MSRIISKIIQSDDCKLAREEMRYKETSRIYIGKGMKTHSQGIASISAITWELIGREMLIRKEKNTAVLNCWLVLDMIYLLLQCLHGRHRYDPRLYQIKSSLLWEYRKLLLFYQMSLRTYLGGHLSFQIM